MKLYFRTLLDTSKTLFKSEQFFIILFSTIRK